MTGTQTLAHDAACNEMTERHTGTDAAAGDRMRADRASVVRLLLLVAYLPLAYVAEAKQSPLLAALALADLTVLVLVGGLLRLRPLAWLALLVAMGGLLLLQRTGFVLPILLLVPACFTALIGACFARSLREGRVPLVVKVIAAVYDQTPQTVSPEHQAYGRALTLAWALLLGVLTALNLALAAIATPNGLFAQLGIAAPVAVTGVRWPLIANLMNYGLPISFAVAEFQFRKRVFPVRPYRNGIEFMRRMAGLGPAFWRDFFR